MTCLCNVRSKRGSGLWDNCWNFLLTSISPGLMVVATSSDTKSAKKRTTGSLCVSRIGHILRTMPFTTLQSSHILAWASVANIQYCKFNMSDVRVDSSRTSDSMSFKYSLLTSQHTQACLPSNPHLGNKHLSQYSVHSPQSLIRL